MQEFVFLAQGYDEDGRITKVCEKKVPMKLRAPLPRKNQGQDKAEQAGMSKNEELGQNLRVVSFIHYGKDEKKGKYKEFESKRVERRLMTMALKEYVNIISE